MARSIRFTREWCGFKSATDSAIILSGDDPIEALAEGVVQSISTDVEIKLGEITIHLAMLLDPDHWESDWRERGIEDPDEFVSGLITEEA
jgi:hypothetical protein